MAGKDPKKKRDDPVEAAFVEYYEAWCSGKQIDPEVFCKSHPECAPGLRKKIENFLLVAGIFPGDLAEERPAPEPEATAEIAGRILGRFRLLREIGRGGMGVVYEAEQIDLNRKVALKILPAYLSFSGEAVKKFRREAEAGGRQTHPCIVAVYDVGEHEGFHFIAQELVGEGYTLADRLEELRKKEDLPKGYFREAAEIVAKVADALQHAHASGVIHRDIKPSNILITKDGAPKVTDFGLAKVEDALALSRTGDFSGTPYYMSPEQASGRRFGIDHRTDIFSLGATLYEMLTLTHPFEGETSQEVLKKVLFAEPRDPCRKNPRVPWDLAVICLKAMEKKPNDRYAGMEDLAADLKSFLTGEVIRARPAGPLTKLWKRSRRNPALSGALGVAALAVAALILAIPSYAIHINREISKADLASDRADEQKAEAEEHSRRILSLSDELRLSELFAEADGLWPAYPENAPAMEAWLKKAEGFRERLTLHMEALEDLRKRASLSRGEDESETVWVFASLEDEWQHDALTALVMKMEKDLFDDHQGMIKQIKERIHFANSIHRRSIEDHQALWDRTISAIADAKENPKYKGFDLEPQIGLVPLGKDPDSGLFEFCHIQTGEIPVRGLDEELEYFSDCGLVLVLIPGGTFNMGAVKPDKENLKGSPNVDQRAWPQEGPVREVNVPTFFLSKYEMTQGQWLRFTGNNPSTFHPDMNEDEPLVLSLLHPVEGISWEDSVKVLSRLGLRLPSEAEWEYAARAGTTTPWWTGEEKESIRGAANLQDITLLRIAVQPDSYGHTWLEDGFVVHGEVNTLRPNPFGLHHVIGNVSEWCRDVYDSYELAPTDGSPYEGTWYRRSYRGSSHSDHFRMGRSSFRMEFPPDHRGIHMGCRPARSIDTQR